MSIRVAFTHHGFYLKPRTLVPFLSWSLIKPGSLRARLSNFRRPCLTTADELGLAGVEEMADGAGLKSVVIRLPRGTTRQQAFDLGQGRVLHMATSNSESVARELAWRDGPAAGLAPMVLWRDEARGAWVEELLRPTRIPTTSDCEQVLEMLASSFYQPAPTNVESWRRNLGPVDPSDPILGEAFAYLAEKPPMLTVSRVHGDVNPGNLYPLADGRVLIGDWEYARTALITYDIWLAARFWRRLSFRNVVTRLLGAGFASHTSWLEIAHRVEWYTVLQTLTPGRADGLMSKLRSELRNLMQKGPTT